MGGFFGGGASVDLASPPAIGNTTPNTGAFTTLSISNNGLSNNLPFLFSGSGGAYAGLYYASPAVVVAHYYNPQIALDENALVRVKSGGAFCFSNSASPLGSLDTYIYRDSGGVIAQRNSTNAQTFRIYNTFTNASNYERGFLRWSSNVLEIGAEAAGTGTQRQLRFPLGTVTASTPLSITQTWNNADVTFTGLQLNATDTASASGSLLMDLQVGGSSRFSITKGGKVSASEDINSSTYVFARNEVYAGGTLGSSQFYAGSSGINLGSGTFLSWTNGNSLGTRDTFLYRDAANIVAQRNSTSAQTFRLYRTFTDASNYERLGFIATRTTRFAIAAENAGTGAARSLEISFYTSASDPTSTDITDGCFSVWKNSGTGTIKLWANDGGTMKSVALA